MEYIHQCPVYNNDNIQVIQWIAQLTGYCIYIDDPLGTISSICGAVSFVCWLGAQLPQVVVNYMNGSVEGLSLGFLLNWFAGDATNFFGCILTGQMPFQIALGGYYMVVDCMLGYQYWYYSRLDKIRHERHLRIYYDELDHAADHYSSSSSDTAKPVQVPPQNDESIFSQSATAASSPKLLTSSFIASFAKLASGAPIGSTTITTATTTTTYIQMFGQLLAWICTFMYLTSRIPQIIKNFNRKSTWGTSMLLFMSALIGNVTYTISILLSPQARDGVTGSEFLRNELPYIIGAAGTVIFDMTIFCQFFYYGNEQTHPDSPRLEVYPVEDHEGGNSNDDDHVHHSYPECSLIPPMHQKKKKGSDHDSSTPLAMSLQTNYSSV